MFHRLNRVVLTAGVSVAVIAAMAGPVSARASAGVSASSERVVSKGPGPINNPHKLPVPLVMNYTATTSDQDTCAGECLEYGFSVYGPLNFTGSSPYTESASSTLGAKITLTHVNDDGDLVGTGPVKEEPTFSSSGEFTPNGSSCQAPASVVLLGADPPTGTGTATLSVSKSGSGPATVDMEAGRDYVEKVKVSTGNCVGGTSTYDTTIQDAGSDLSAVEDSPGATDTVDINWGWNGGGTYATETLSGTVPWPKTPGQTDDGSITVKETWTVGCPAASTADERIACITELAVFGLPLSGWKNGGRIPYSHGGGHVEGQPGPSYGTCDGYEGQELQKCLNNPTGPLYTYGLDCSGFTRWVYSLAYGKDVFGDTSVAQQINLPGMTKVTTEPAAGDLVFYEHPNKEGVLVWDHVNIMVSATEKGGATHTGSFANFAPAANQVDGTPYYYQYTPPR